MNIKLITIGNSKGIRLPKKLIDKYHLQDDLILEAREDGILIKPRNISDLHSWENTFTEMAAEEKTGVILIFLMMKV